MKTLTQHISEKLIINRNYKNVDDIESLFDNIEFEHDEDEGLETSDDIFSIMVNYIRDNNIERFPDFDSYKKIATKNNGTCLAIFNKRIKDMNIFQKMTDYVYNNLVIFKSTGLDLYRFEKYGLRLPAMLVLRNINSWNNANEVEYYEISEETFEGISKLYDKLIKK